MSTQTGRTPFTQSNQAPSMQNSARNSFENFVPILIRATNLLKFIRGAGYTLTFNDIFDHLLEMHRSVTDELRSLSLCTNHFRTHGLRILPEDWDDHCENPKHAVQEVIRVVEAIRRHLRDREGGNNMAEGHMCDNCNGNGTRDQEERDNDTDSDSDSEMESSSESSSEPSESSNESDVITDNDSDTGYEQFEVFEEDFSALVNEVLSEPSDEFSARQGDRGFRSISFVFREQRNGGGMAEPGASNEQIAMLGTVDAADGDVGKVCTICMCPFEMSETLRRLPCMDIYHQECIDRWLRTSATCPVDRTRVFNR